MRRQFLAVVGTLALASLFASSSALARAGDRTLEQTYPVATALCARAHAATLPSKLVSQATAVIAARDTLENAFPSLVSTVDAAESTFAGTASTQSSAVASPCTRPVTNHPACVTARLTARTTIANARATEGGDRRLPRRGRDQPQHVLVHDRIAALVLDVRLRSRS
jgi:hypothetical protein